MQSQCPTFTDFFSDLAGTHFISDTADLFFRNTGDTAIRLSRRLTFFYENTPFSYFDVYKPNFETKDVKY